MQKLLNTALKIRTDNPLDTDSNTYINRRMSAHISINYNSKCDRVIKCCEQRKGLRIIDIYIYIKTKKEGRKENIKETDELKNNN